MQRPSGVLGAYHVAYLMVVAPDGRFLHPKNDHPMRRPSGMLQGSLDHPVDLVFSTVLENLIQVANFAMRIKSLITHVLLTLEMRNKEELTINICPYFVLTR